MEESIWNNNTRELLVEYVKCYPSLWDRRNTDYSRKDKNGKRWAKIGHFLDCSGDEAQSQFNFLKTRFSRYIEKLKKHNSRRVKPFFLAEKMGYLLSPETLDPIKAAQVPKLPKLSTKKRRRSKVTIKESFSSLNLDTIFVYADAANPQKGTGSMTQISQAAGDPAMSNDIYKASALAGPVFGIPRRPPPNNVEEAISIYAEVLGEPFEDGACSLSFEDPSEDTPVSNPPKGLRSMRSRKNRNFCTRNKSKNKKKNSQSI